MKYNRDMIIQKSLSENTGDYVFFWGHTPKPNKVTKACLSQWFDCCFTAKGVHYHTTEQYMMAQKALLFDDQETCAQIMASDNPKDYKALGRLVKGFSAEIWDANKYDIVLQGNIAKFSQNPHLWEYLDSTLDAVLVEASPYDGIWGVGLAMDDPRIQDPKRWQGDNLLGFALMETRDILRERYQSLVHDLEYTDFDLDKIFNALNLGWNGSLLRYQEFTDLGYYNYFRKNEDYFISACISFCQDGLWGFLSAPSQDSDEMIVCQPEWDDIETMASGYKAGESTCYFLRVQKDQKWGIVDTRGRRITPCKWDEIDDFGNCRAGDAWGFVNLLTMEETQPQWQYNQNLAPYEVIDHYEESIDYQGFGPSCAWSTTCTILNGNSL